MAEHGAAREPLVDPGLAEGRSRLILLGGLVALALGHTFAVGAVVWLGIASVAGAFLLNTVGKVGHYRTLGVSRRALLALAGTWLGIVASVCGVLAGYAVARFGPFAEAPYFWSLAVAAVGFALLHMAAQSKHLPADRIRQV